MATKLKNGELTSVDLVRAGANQDADIMLFKSAEQEESPMQGYFDALAQSVKSIADDPTIDEKQKLEMLLESMEQFREAVHAEEPEPEEGPAPAQEPAEEPVREPAEEPVREPEYEDIMEEEEDRYDDLEDDDRYEEIVEVHKFNPFHDGRGRFASSNGFASYSADPNKKAGAMAIARSVAAGHGKTVNVHSASGGASLTQNATAIGGRGSAGTLRNRVEPMTGLKGASQFGAMSHAANQKAGKVIQPKQTQPKQTQPKQTPTQTQPKQTTQPKPTKAKTTELETSIHDDFTKKTGFNDTTAGMVRAAITPDTMKNIGVKANMTEATLNKDISKSLPAKLDFDRSKGEFPLDAVARLQGNGKAAVTDDADLFTKACMASGIMLRRSVRDNSGKGMTGEDICKSTMTEQNPKNQYGGTVRGSGRYFTIGKMDARNTPKSLQESKTSESESAWYGDRQMLATLRPGAKVCTKKEYTALQKKFDSLPAAEKDKFKTKGLDKNVDNNYDNAYDINAYIAAKGYDFIAARGRAKGEYGTVLNDNALLYFNEIGEV